MFEYDFYSVDIFHGQNVDLFYTGEFVSYIELLNVYMENERAMSWFADIVILPHNTNTNRYVFDDIKTYEIIVTNVSSKYIRRYTIKTNERTVFKICREMSRRYCYKVGVYYQEIR